MSDLDSPRAIHARGRDFAAAISLSDTAKDAARLYESALRTYGTDGVDWKQVNAAVLARWAPSTLNWIKKQAWDGCRCRPEDVV